MIEMQEVDKNYNDFHFHLSMKIPKGQITGLIGKNGAGKSTAIKLILGLIKPDSGTVKVFGTPIKKLEPDKKQAIGVSLAESGFSTQLTISDIEQILEKTYIHFEKEKFEQKCKLLNLPKKKKLQEFSTGMKAKLKVLTAITHKARFLILDEPTSGLDIEARTEILDLLRDYLIEDENRSILITSHISADLETLCDDIYLVHNGKLMLHEKIDVILEQYGILKVMKEQYETLDKEAILKIQKEAYGYACLTNDKNYYLENYPQIAVENGRIDALILMTTGGY